MKKQENKIDLHKSCEAQDFRHWPEGLIKEAEETMTMEEKLRGLAAACYMMCGVLVHDGAPIPTKWLDVLSAAANGLPFSDEGLLPFEGWPMLRAGGRSDCGPNESPKSLAPVEATGSETPTEPEDYYQCSTCGWEGHGPCLCDDQVIEEGTR